MQQSKLLVISACIMMSLSACNGDGVATTSSSTSDSGTTGGTSTAVNLKGTLGSSYSYNQPSFFDRFLRSAIADYAQIKKAIAIPKNENGFGYEFAKEIAIGNDGSFSVDLPKKITSEGREYTVSWVVLLEKLDGTVEFLSIPAQNNETLLEIPIANVPSNLDIGTVNSQAGEAQSSSNTTVLANIVSLNVADLQQLAKNDDYLKAAANWYLNSYGRNNSTVTTETLQVVSSGNYDSIGANYNLAAAFQGYAFHFHAGKNSAIATGFNSICGSAGSLKLYPPDSTSLSTGSNNDTFTSSSPLSSGAASITTQSSGEKECSGGISYLRKDTDGQTTVNFIVGDDTSQLIATKPIPNGIFKLRMGDQLIGNYQLSYNLPLANNVLKVPVPAIKLNLDSNNRILGINIKWRSYNAVTNAFDLIDSATLSSVVDGFSIHLDDFDGVSGNSNRLEVSCSNITPATNYVDLSTCTNYQPMTYNYSGGDMYVADDINVNLYMLNTEYRFTYRRTIMN